MPDLLMRDTDRDELVADIAAAVLESLRPIFAESQEPRLVDGDRMAQLAGVSRPTIDRLVRADQIPSVLIGRRRLFEPRRVIDALASPNEKGGGSHDV